jgi:hypothetical protein
MVMILKNDILELEIQEPGALYKGSRFDWTGQITQIRYRGKHTLCTEETTDPGLLHMLGRGLYNEFGIDKPVGYDDCAIGDKFPKIGIGLLTRDNSEAYNFFKPYIIDPFIFNINIDKDHITYNCDASEYRGYAFHLKKTIALLENTFSISYEFENKGRHQIVTNEYIHNFLAINRRPIDHHYKLRFSFQVDPTKFGETVNPDNIVQFEKDALTWKNQPKKQFFFSNIYCGQTENVSWMLEHNEDKIGITERVDFRILRMNLWGAGHVISPEIFYQLIVAPGEIKKWLRTYKVYQLGNI